MALLKIDMLVYFILFVIALVIVYVSFSVMKYRKRKKEERLDKFIYKK